MATGDQALPGAPVTADRAETAEPLRARPHRGSGGCWLAGALRRSDTPREPAVTAGPFATTCDLPLVRLAGGRQTRPARGGGRGAGADVMNASRQGGILFCRVPNPGVK